MSAISLEKDLETELKLLATQMKKPLAECLREAVSDYIHDRKDYMVGVAALERNESSITLDELESRFGLDRCDQGDRRTAVSQARPTNPQ